MTAKVGSFSAWIQMEGRGEIDCYAPEYSRDGRTVTCWIASESGKTFSVHWKDSRRSYATQGQVSLDGTRCGGAVMRSWREQPGYQYDTTCRKKMRTSETTSRAFMFSNLELTDDEYACLSEARAENIGRIELVIRRVHITGQSPTAWKAHDRQRVNDMEIEQAVYENQKKTGVHKVSLGPEIINHRSRGCPDRGTDLRKLETVATFIFKYTSLEMLLANGIASAPRSATPQFTPRPSCYPPEPNCAQPCYNDAGIELLSDDARINPQATNKRRRDHDCDTSTKQEPSMFTNGSSKRVKQEPLTTLHAVEVIDLTLD